MSTRHRRIPEGADLPEITRILNRQLDVLFGNEGGRIRLFGDNGVEVDINGGAPISTLNYPLYIQSAVGNHQEVMHSAGTPAVFRAQDTGVTAPIITGDTRFANNVDVDGTFNADGAATFNGAVTLGNAAGDTITVTGTATFTPLATFTGGLTSTGTGTFNGALVANGAVTLGNAAADVVTITGTATFAEIVTLTKGLVVDTTTLVVDAVNNKVGILTATPASVLDVVGVVRSTSNAGGAATGAGIEMFYASGTGTVRSWDATGVAYAILDMAGTEVAMQASGTDRIKVDGTGIGFFNTSPVGQPAAGAAAGGTLAQVTTLANDLRTGLRDLGLFS